MPTTWSAPEIAIGAEAAMVAVSILTSLLSAVRPTRVAALAVAALVASASSDTPTRYPSLFREAIDLLLC